MGIKSETTSSFHYQKSKGSNTSFSNIYTGKIDQDAVLNIKKVPQSEEYNVTEQLEDIKVENNTNATIENLKVEKKTYEEMLEPVDKELAAIKSFEQMAESAQYGGNVTVIDAQVKQLTRFNSLAELLASKEEIKDLEADKIYLDQAIYKINQQIKMTPYDNLEKLEAYQNFTLNENIDLNIANWELKWQGSATGESSAVLVKNISDGINLEEIDPLLIAEQIRTLRPDLYQYYKKEMSEELITLLELGNESFSKKYHYLFATEGKEKAETYLKDIKDQLNQKAGEKKAQEFLNTLEKDENGNYDLTKVSNYLNTILKGSGDGIESFFSGLTAWFEKDHVYSVDEYESMYIIQELSKNKEFKNVLDNTYELSQSMGNMAPSIAIGILCPGAGTLSMGASAGGSSYHQAMVEGSDQISAITYGVLSGVSEATLEKYLGALPGLSEVSATSLKSFAQAMLQEGIEEGTQEYVDALLQYKLLNQDFDIKEVTKNAGKSALYGMIMGGIFNTPELVSSKLKGSVGNENINKLNQTMNEFTDSDMAFLLREATMNDQVKTLNGNNQEFQSKVHQIFDNIYGVGYVQEVIESIKTVNSSDWRILCQQYGANPTTTRGFVTTNGDLFLPETAVLHEAYHEVLHKLSEYKGQNTRDAQGNIRKKTGIREFYTDGNSSTIANEALTDYLASAIDDKLLYDSMYSISNVKLWNRIDDALKYLQGSDSNSLLSCYLLNNTNYLRSIFDKFAYTGAYDEFVIKMEKWDKNGKALNKIVNKIEKNIYPSKIESAIDSIFGKIKSNNDNTNNSAVNNNVQMNATSAVYYAIDKMMEKYNFNYQEAIEKIEDYAKTGIAERITRNGDARKILMQFDLTEVQNALDNIKRASNNSSKTDTYSIDNSKTETYSIENNQPENSSLARMFAMISDPIKNLNNLAKITEAYHLNRFNSSYNAFVSVNSYNHPKNLPSMSTKIQYFNRFENSGKYNVGRQKNAFLHVRSMDFFQKFTSKDIAHRLYINADYEATYQFAQRFADKCEERGIPFYFKTGIASSENQSLDFTLKRDESMVIYSPEKHLLDYINICNEIKAENPTLTINPPPIFSGVINDWIGYGNETEDHSHSFNQIRTGLITESINKVDQIWKNRYNIQEVTNIHNYREYLTDLYSMIRQLSPKYGVSVDNFCR